MSIEISVNESSTHGLTTSQRLMGSKTIENLKAAFAGESQANRRYLYFADQAQTKGDVALAQLFRDVAEGETGHAHGHMDYMPLDPVTNTPIGSNIDNLNSAILGEVHEYTDMYPSMAHTARAEGFEEIAIWFETLSRAEKTHANRFQKALDERVSG